MKSSKWVRSIFQIQALSVVIQKFSPLVGGVIFNYADAYLELYWSILDNIIRQSKILILPFNLGSLNQ